MFRIVVAFYLMIVTAVGPAACCCTLTRSTTKFMPSTSSAPPTPAPCGCCPTPPNTDSQDEPTRRCPDAPGCPCKRADREVLALPAAPQEALDASARDASGPFHFYSAILLDQVVSPVCGSSVFREGVGTPSSATTDNLLYAFHMLRC